MPADAFDEAMRYRDEYRKSHPPAAGEQAPAAAADGSLSAPPDSALARLLRGLEHALLIGTLLAAALLPLADTLGRPFGGPRPRRRRLAASR